MLTNYKQKCENFVKEWIKTNTRYELNDIVLDDYKDFVADFSVEVINQFSVECSKTTRKGSVTSGDEMYYKKSEYQSAIQKHITREFNTERNFQHLIDEVQSGCYGKYNVYDIIDSGDTLLYEYSCNKCKGNGEVKCDKCKAGQIRCNASGCRNGKVEKTRQVNGKSKKYYENCGKCRGSGFITCPKCKGTAWIKCENCNATGILTEVGRIVMVTHAQYKPIYLDDFDNTLKEAIEKYCYDRLLSYYSYAKLAKITNIERESIKQSNSKKYVWEKYNAKIPFVKFSVLFDDKKFAWFIYGTDLQIYENSGMLNAILASDINALVKIANQSFFTNIMILKNSKVAVANFMESAINQQIIISDSTNKDEKIDERVESILFCVDKSAEVELLLNDFDTSLETSEITRDDNNSTSVSSDYIKQTIQAFDKIAKDFCMGITCISNIVAFIIGLILALTILPYGVFSPLIIFPLFIYCGNVYKNITFKKYWGEKLFNWVGKREVNQTGYFLYTLIGEAIIFTITYCVNIQNNVNILDMF